jgi:hypothetical protein
MTTSTRTILIAFSVILVLLVCGLGYGLYKINAVGAEVASLETEAMNLEQVDSIAQTIRSARNIASGDIAELEGITLTQAKLVSFIETIESLGRGMNLETDTISVSADKTSIRLTIETEGGWASSIRFVQALENLPYRVNIEESVLAAGAGSKTWRSRSMLNLPSF